MYVLNGAIMIHTRLYTFTRCLGIIMCVAVSLKQVDLASPERQSGALFIPCK